VTDDGDGRSLSVVGLVTIAVGVTAVVAASIGLLPAGLSLSGWLSPLAVAALFVLAGAAVAVAGRSERSDTSQRMPADDTVAAAPDATQFGEGIETCLTAPDAAGLRSELRRTAVTVLELRTDCSRSQAATQVQQGTWTSDRVAAATLGGEDAPAFRADERLLAVLLPRRTLRTRAERTIAAVESIEMRADQAHGDAPTSTRSSDGATDSRAASHTASVDPAPTDTDGSSTSRDAGKAGVSRSQATGRGEESSDRIGGSLDA
jgi:hypothetical protein